MLDHKAEFDTTGNNLSYMLSSAVNRGHVRLFKTIVGKCGDVLFKNETDNKSLMRSALISGSLEIVKILQSQNIPLDISASITGATPLHNVASNPNALEMIKFLTKNVVDINARTNDGRSAYNIAEASGNKEALSLILGLGGNAECQKFPVLTGPYMGQAPPGKEPKRFAPGIVYPSHCTITISNDGNEMYWGNGFSILFSKIQNGQWTKPDYASFSGKSDINFYDDVPFISPDNKKLFFTSRRPIDTQSENSKKENIWFVERTPTGWSEPKPVSVEVNALSLHWQVSVSNSGTLYFGGTRQDGFGSSDIYYTKLVNGKYMNPENIGPVINSKDGEGMPYIAPYETFLIFSRQEDVGSFGRGDLYISYRKMDGSWTKAINMGSKINSKAMEICPIGSPDGKYLFFMRHHSVMWVDAKIIEELRPKDDN